MDIPLKTENSFLSQELQGVSYVYRILCTMEPHPCQNLQSHMVRKELQQKNLDFFNSYTFFFYYRSLATIYNFQKQNQLFINRKLMVFDFNSLFFYLASAEERFLKYAFSQEEETMWKYKWRTEEMKMEVWMHLEIFLPCTSWKDFEYHQTPKKNLKFYFQLHHHCVNSHLLVFVSINLNLHSNAYFNVYSCCLSKILNLFTKLVGVVYENYHQNHFKYTIQTALFSHILPTVIENWEFTGTDNLLWVRWLIARPTKTSALHSHNCYNPFPLVPGVLPSCTLEFLFLKDAEYGKSVITFSSSSKKKKNCLAASD